MLTGGTSMDVCVVYQRVSRLKYQWFNLFLVLCVLLLLFLHRGLQSCPYLQAGLSSAVLHVWQAAVGVSVTHAAAHHPHLFDGEKSAEGSTWKLGNVTEAGHPHPESRQPWELWGRHCQSNSPSCHRSMSRRSNMYLQLSCSLAHWRKCTAGEGWTPPVQDDDVINVLQVSFLEF